MKFELRDSYAIFLHDTPSRQLFNPDERMFSSGCIRVENPLDLAQLLLGDSTRIGLLHGPSEVRNYGGDRVGIVTYSNEAEVRLEPTAVDDDGAIRDVIAGLEPGQGLGEETAPSPRVSRTLVYCFFPPLPVRRERVGVRVHRVDVGC